MFTPSDFKKRRWKNWFDTKRGWTLKRISDTFGLTIPHFLHMWKENIRGLCFPRVVETRHMPGIAIERKCDERRTGNQNSKQLADNETGGSIVQREHADVVRLEESAGLSTGAENRCRGEGQQAGN